MIFILFLFSLHFINIGKEVIFLFSEVLILLTHYPFNLSKSLINILGGLALYYPAPGLVSPNFYRGNILRFIILKLSRWIILLRLMLGIQIITIISSVVYSFSTVCLGIIILLVALFILRLCCHKLLWIATWRLGEFKEIIMLLSFPCTPCLAINLMLLWWFIFWKWLWHIIILIY